MNVVATARIAENLDLLSIKEVFVRLEATTAVAVSVWLLRIEKSEEVLHCLVIFRHALQHPSLDL